MAQNVSLGSAGYTESLHKFACFLLKEWVGLKIQIPLLDLVGRIQA